jgi:chromosome partitioning protein
LGQLLNTIKIVRQHLNPDLEIEGVLLTMFDTRLNLSNQVAQEVRRYFGDKVFETIVQRNVRLSEAPSFGKPAILYEASSKGAKNYMALAREILEKNQEFLEDHHANENGEAESADAAEAADSSTEDDSVSGAIGEQSESEETPADDFSL